MFSLDRHDGFYALGIAPEIRDYFMANVRNQLNGLAGLPMGWSLSPFQFCRLTETFSATFGQRTHRAPPPPPPPLASKGDTTSR
jgi:hypothetical protein